MSEPIRILAVGDLVLDEPDPAFFFAPSASILAAADVAIGQIEVPHSTSTDVTSVDIPAPPADPSHVAVVGEVGFDVVTLAGNHLFDVGTQGVLDTIRLSREAGMVPVGAGANLDEAREPAIVERGGRRVGVLDYNCVGPRESWATSKKAGAAYIKVLTHYELDSANPGGPPTVYSFCEPAGLRRLREDVAALAAQVDVVIVAFHKGVGHTPAAVADYEKEVAYVAVDAGAHAVLGHHAHILRGIEMYRGRPIFHGLGNFVTVTKALSITPGTNSVEREAWGRRRRELFGFEPDPAMPTYPFHPESRNTVIATLDVGADGTIDAGFIPCWIDDDARPVPLGDDEQGHEVAAYMEDISRRAGFDTAFVWVGSQVAVGPAEEAR